MGGNKYKQALADFVYDVSSENIWYGTRVEFSVDTCLFFFYRSQFFNKSPRLKKYESNLMWSASKFAIRVPFSVNKKG